MGRSPCCAREGLNRGAWTAMEDKILTDYIKVHGEGKWRNLPIRAGLKRCGKSCRLRWLNYLKPDIKRGNITRDEEDLIIRLHKLLGNRWSLIAGRLPGRTDNEIKNYWNTNIGKKVQADQSNSSAPARRSSTRSQDHSKTKHHYSSSFSLAIRHKRTPPMTPVQPPHHVVRTKATRCTKAFFSRFEPVQNKFQPQTGHMSCDITKQPSTDDHHDHHDHDHRAADGDYGSRMCQPTFPGLQTPPVDSEMMMMMMGGELQQDDNDRFLSEVLETDFLSIPSDLAAGCSSNSHQVVMKEDVGIDHDIMDQYLSSTSLSNEDMSTLFFNNDDMQGAAAGELLDINWIASLLGSEL